MKGRQSEAHGVTPGNPLLNTLYVDAMITITANMHGLTVASRNVADFKALGFDPAPDGG